MTAQTPVIVTIQASRPMIFAPPAGSALPVVPALPVVAGGSVRTPCRKTVLHPQVGPIFLDCETLLTPDQGQLLLVLTPVDAEAAEKLSLLSVIGLQEFPAPTG